MLDKTNHADNVLPLMVLLGSGEERVKPVAVSTSLDMCPWFICGGDGESDLHGLLFSEK